MTWLLRLYPRAWRERYGAEVADVVASRPKSWQLAVDLLGGAVDAHLKPQAFAGRMEAETAGTSGGKDMVTRLLKCESRSRIKMTRKEAWLGAALTIGSALVIAGIMLFDRGPVGEAIGLTMFPGVLVVGLQPAYLRGHSTTAKIAVIGGTFLVLFLIGLTAGLIVD